MVKVEQNAASVAKTAPNDGFTFRNCQQLPLHERVAIKQQAVDNALRFTQELSKVLRGEATKRPGRKPKGILSKEMIQWLSEADERRQDHGSFGVSIGVRGATGAGKSSLLNALLGLPDLLPVSCSEASTATASQISWNFENDQKKAFRAEIIFRTVEDLTKEIGELIADIKERDQLAHGTGPENGDDGIPNYDYDDTMEALNEKIDEITQKLQHNWVIDERKILDDNISARGIIFSNEEVSKLLGTTLEISAPTAHNFSEPIRPYLDSSPTENSVTAWPLVQDVKIFVKSMILKNGVRLVDPPGASDVVVARSKVAEKYASNLYLTILVLPAVCAIDEKTGVNLMSEYQGLATRMAGESTGPDFCAVISHIDNLDCNTSIANSAYARKDQKLENIQNDMENLKSELESTARSLTLEEEKRGSEREKMDRQRANEDVATESLRRLNAANKRKINASRETIDQAISDKNESRKNSKKAYREAEEAETTINSLKKRRSDVQSEQDMLDKKRQHRCTWLRSQYQHERIKEGFRNRQRILLKSLQIESGYDGEVDVFFVSSRAYTALLRDGDKPLRCFPSALYTGIPRLEQWIYQNTLEKRERHLNKLLSSYKGLYTDITRWCDTQPGDKVDFSRLQIENIIESAYNMFEQKMDERMTRLVEDLRKIIPSGEAESIASSNKLDTLGGQVAARWVKKIPDDPSPYPKRMAYSTYQAILRRGGGAYTSNANPSQHYDWPAKLSTEFIRLFISKWSKSFHVEMPQSIQPFYSEITSIWRQLLDEIQGHFTDTAPGLLTQFSKNRRELEEREKEARQAVEDFLSHMCGKSSTDHFVFTNSIRTSLDSVFRTALSIRAVPNCFKERQTSVNSTVRKISSRIFTEAYNSMIAAHEEHLARFEYLSCQLPRCLVISARRNIGIMLEKMEGDKGKDKKMLSSKAKLQEAVRALTMQWASRWRDSGSASRTTKDLDIPETYTETFAPANSKSERTGKEGGEDLDVVNILKRK